MHLTFSCLQRISLALLEHFERAGGPSHSAKLGDHNFNVAKWRFAAALWPRLFGNSIPGHTTRAPQVGLELATNVIQFYVIANLDKTSQWHVRQACYIPTCCGAGHAQQVPRQSVGHTSVTHRRRLIAAAPARRNRAAWLGSPWRPGPVQAVQLPVHLSLPTPTLRDWRIRPALLLRVRANKMLGLSLWIWSI